MKIADTEFITDNVTVSQKDCNGCLRHNRDIMLTVTANKDGEFYYIFLTTTQAENLVKQMSFALDQNASTK